MNKFFNLKDDSIDILDEFIIPEAWWSRFYEYKFASEFLDKEKIVADAGCGVEHPFKWYAAKRSKKLYCIDQDDRVGELKLDENMVFINENLITFSLPELVDTIFCISVLEHIQKPAIPCVLDNFKNSLKPGGKVILTCDYPTIGPDMVQYYAESVGLKVVGNIDYDPNREGNLYHDIYFLKAFSMVLEKEAIKEEKEIINKEVKDNGGEKVQTKKVKKKVGDKDGSK